MAQNALLQVRMDAELKSEVEQLYRQMGMSFSEAVRIFAQQSLIQRRLPLDVSIPGATPPHSKGLPLPEKPGEAESPFGMLSSYADPSKHAREKDAWRKAATAKRTAKGDAK